MKTRRILAWVMSLALCAALLPAGVRAAVTTPTAQDWTVAWTLSGTENTNWSLSTDKTELTVLTADVVATAKTATASFSDFVGVLDFGAAGATLTLKDYGGANTIAVLGSSYSEGFESYMVTVSTGTDLTEGNFALGIYGSGASVAADAKLEALTLTNSSAALAFSASTALSAIAATDSFALANPTNYPSDGLALTLTATDEEYPASFLIGADEASVNAGFTAPLTATVLYAATPTVTLKDVTASGGQVVVATNAELAVKDGDDYIVRAKCQSGDASTMLVIDELSVSGSIVTLKNAYETTETTSASDYKPVGLYVAPDATLALTSTTPNVNGITLTGGTGGAGCVFSPTDETFAVWGLTASSSFDAPYNAGFTSGSSVEVQNGGALAVGVVDSDSFGAKLNGALSYSFGVSRSDDTAVLKASDTVLTVMSGVLADSSVTSVITGSSVIHLTGTDSDMGSVDIFKLSTPATPTTCSVTFNLNGGTWSGPSGPLTVETGKSLNDYSSLPKPTKAGQVFDCWCSDEGLSMKWSFTKKFTGDTTLYAKYKDKSSQQQPQSERTDNREPDEPYTQQIPATLTFEGGRIAVSPTNTVEKQTVTLTAIPNENWELATLTVRRAHGTYPVALTNRSGGVYTFNHPGVEVVVEATFAPVSALQATQPTAPVQPAGAPKVVLSPQKIKVNGVEQTVEAYNIDGTNFFKLRDLAAMLGGTPAQFNVEYNAASNAVLVTKGAAYNGSVGTDFTDNSASAVRSPQTVFIDGASTALTAYNIGGSNFFGLRELATILGYSVDYDAATNTAIIESR